MSEGPPERRGGEARFEQGWDPGAEYGRRASPLSAEIGTLWGRCGVDSEVAPLRAVLLHRPGPELEAVAADSRAALMYAAPDSERAAAQHRALVEAYRREGIRVELVNPPEVPPPNQMFCADLFFMTAAGAIVGRPAAAARAGEERWVARRLADLGVPILRTVFGDAAFEGADACWLAPDRVLLGYGPRTDESGVEQVRSILNELAVEVTVVELPPKTMHLMGQLRFLDESTALVWRSRIGDGAFEALDDAGFTVESLPDEDEAEEGMALNFVTVGPHRVVMPAGNPETRRFLASLGVEAIEVEVDEIAKAAGAIGCLTGILERSRTRGTNARP